MKPAAAQALLLWAEEVIKTYNPVTSSVDTHAREMLGDTEGEDADPDAMFVQQVFYGCVRYKKFLKLFNASFFHVKSSSVSRRDYVKFMILAYVTFFRLDDVGVAAFRDLLLGLPAPANHHFASYAFSVPQLTDWVKDEWIKIVDLDFVENVIFARLKRHGAALRDLQAELEQAAVGAEAAAAQEKEDEGDAALLRPPAKPPTKPQPFALTRPRRRKLPQPMRIEQVAAANPVPEHLNKVTLDHVERQAEERRQRVKQDTLEKYERSGAKPFKFGESRANVDELARQVAAEREKECHFGSELHMRPAPPPPARKAAVRLNAAAVLREDALYRRKQEQEAAMIQAYESELRDSTDFYSWQSRMQEREDAEMRRALYRRKQEMAAAAKEAVEANERVKQERLRRGTEQRQATEEELRAEEVRKRAELAVKQGQAVEIRTVRQTAPRAAEARVAEQKRREREELRTDLEERRRRKEEEDAREAAVRQDLIRQIRALERVPVRKAKQFDPTETSGVGLLEELSLAELRERLELNQKREAKEQERKRDGILLDKEEQQEDIRRRMSRIARVREAAAAKNRSARARRKAAEARRKEEEERAREDAVLEAAERLEQQRERRRKEKAELEAEEAAIAKRRMFLGAEKSQVEAKHFEDQQAGAEREIKVRQWSAKRRAEAAEEVKAHEERQRRARVRAAQRTEKQAKAASRQHLEDARRDQAERDFEEQQDKKARFRATREVEAAALRTRDSRNQYAADLTQTLRERARTRTLRRTGLATLGRPTGAQQAEAM